MKRREEIARQKLNEWLGGLTMEEKIKTLEQGKLLQCSECGYIVFDRLEPEDYVRKCKCANRKHVFIPMYNYIILRRCFSGIADVVHYLFEKPEEAVTRYFQCKRWN